ncbi:hypothetical protein GCM10010331_77000 [Streptomyces xanthochromogenes]|nr:hypothetical protein GCM10010331_77000 [Streptomyces xanthochromogenes]
MSPVELTDSVLERCTAVEGQLNAYVTVVADHARAAAAQAQREIRSGRRLGPLHGIPYGLKDLIDTAGITRTASSRLWEGRVPTADSTVAALLSAGAVLVGKTHTHEFHYGLLTPQTANPWAAQHIAGGSSGGSAVAVAAGSALFALGTDTGGSIRVPAALNGVSGLRPAYGLISRHGGLPCRGPSTTSALRPGPSRTRPWCSKHWLTTTRTTGPASLRHAPAPGRARPTTACGDCASGCP